MKLCRVAPCSIDETKAAMKKEMQKDLTIIDAERETSFMTLGR
jgi:hypothetical protein